MQMFELCLCCSRYLSLYLHSEQHRIKHELVMLECNVSLPLKMYLSPSLREECQEQNIRRIFCPEKKLKVSDF